MPYDAAGVRSQCAHRLQEISKGSSEEQVRVSTVDFSWEVIQSSRRVVWMSTSQIPTSPVHPCVAMCFTMRHRHVSNDSLTLLCIPSSASRSLNWNVV